MAAQMNYNYGIPKGVAGGIYDIADHHIFSRRNEEADGVMGYGVVVVAGDAKGSGSKLPSTGAQREDFEGIVVHHANTEQDMNGKVTIKNGSTLSIMRRGSIWTKIAPGCVPGYRKKAYVAVDGDFRGYVTDQTGEYSQYEKCDKDAEGAKEITQEDSEEKKIKLEDVHPVADGYTPKIGDWVVSKKIHGVTVYSGAFFGNESDIKNGIAVIDIE